MAIKAAALQRKRPLSAKDFAAVASSSRYLNSLAFGRVRLQKFTGKAYIQHYDPTEGKWKALVNMDYGKKDQYQVQACQKVMDSVLDYLALKPEATKEAAIRLRDNLLSKAEATVISKRPASAAPPRVRARKTSQSRALVASAAPAAAEAGPSAHAGTNQGSGFAADTPQFQPHDWFFGAFFF